MIPLKFIPVTMFQTQTLLNFGDGRMQCNNNDLNMSLNKSLKHHHQAGRIKMKCLVRFIYVQNETNRSYFQHACFFNRRFSRKKLKKMIALPFNYTFLYVGYLIEFIFLCTNIFMTMIAPIFGSFQLIVKYILHIVMP